MNSETSQVIQSYIEDGDTKKGVSEWGAAKISYLKGIEEFASMREVDPDAPLTEEEEKIKAALDSKIAEVDERLARLHYDRGLAALSNKAYKRALDELEEATRLAKDEDVKFLEEVKQVLDKAKIKYRDHNLHVELSPFVERGDDFKAAGNYAEAILEYQAALKQISGLPKEHRFTRYISLAITDCRRNLIRPYLARINKACHCGKYSQAATLLKRAQLILNDQDSVYSAFLEQLREKIVINLSETEVQETEEFESAEVWETAIKDYEEALDLYSSFTITDPLSPAYTGVNVFEDRFFNSRKKLGHLYKTRADKLRDQAKLEKAMRNYKEALKLLPRSDKLFHEAFRELKKLRGQISKPKA